MQNITYVSKLNIYLYRQIKIACIILTGCSDCCSRWFPLSSVVDCTCTAVVVVSAVVVFASAVDVTGSIVVVVSIVVVIGSTVVVGTYSTVNTCKDKYSVAL